MPFVDKNVAQDRTAAVEMVRRSGQQGVPVIATDDEVIVGFDQVRLGRIAKRFAAPKAPPFGVMAANVSDYFASHPEAAATAPGVTTGVYVGKVRPGTVAANAGLQPGRCHRRLRRQACPGLGRARQARRIGLSRR